jgi:hypothetical protein
MPEKQPFRVFITTPKSTHSIPMDTTLEMLLTEILIYMTDLLYLGIGEDQIVLQAVTLPDGRVVHF